MNKQKSINFFKGMIELVEHYQEDTTSVREKLAEHYKLAFSIVATREHLTKAYELFNGIIKARKETLQFNYATMLYVRQPYYTCSEIQSIIKEQLNISIRDELIPSAAAKAARMRAEMTPEEINLWCNRVLEEHKGQQKETNVLT